MANVGYSSEKAKFFSVLADGKFHHSVAEGTPGAVKREYETKEGVESFKWELQADFIEGTIDYIAVRDGEYGKQLQITFKGDGSDDLAVTVSLNLSSNFAEDFLQKLPNIKTDKNVRLVPFAFEDDKGKSRKGITVYQGKSPNEEKVLNYYKKSEKKDDKTVMSTVNGYPEIPKEAFSKTKKWGSDDWKMYFMQARKFLVEELEKNPIYKDLNVVSNTTESDEINPDEMGWDKIGTESK